MTEQACTKCTTYCTNPTPAEATWELVRLLLADALDDVDCSGSTLVYRNKRCGELVDNHMADEDKAQTIFNDQLADATHYDSGTPIKRHVGEEGTPLGARVWRLHKPEDCKLVLTDGDVLEQHACPDCGERRADWLVWQDEQKVKCTSCGQAYYPGGDK